MITYAYWFLVIALIGAVVFFVGFRMDAWKATFVASAILLVTGWGAYYFHFEQIFVKKWGGVMSLSVPDGCPLPLRTQRPRRPTNTSRGYSTKPAFCGPNSPERQPEEDDRVKDPAIRLPAIDDVLRLGPIWCVVDIQKIADNCGSINARSVQAPYLRGLPLSVC